MDKFYRLVHKALGLYSKVIGAVVGIVFYPALHCGAVIDAYKKANGLSPLPEEYRIALGVVLVIVESMTLLFGGLGLAIHYGVVR